MTWRERCLVRAEAAEIAAQSRIGQALHSQTHYGKEDMVFRAKAHAGAGTLDLARQLLIGRYQTMLSNQIDKTLQHFFKHSNNELPVLQIEEPVNGYGTTINLEFLV